MAKSQYHFVDRWRVEGNVEEVADILEDAVSLPRWWESVYFDVKEIERVPDKSFMPSYKGKLTDEQLNDLVAYLASLGGAK